MDKVDRLINNDRPVVQDSERENHVEVVLPRSGRTLVMSDDVFMDFAGEGVRIITSRKHD